MQTPFTPDKQWTAEMAEVSPWLAAQRQRDVWRVPASYFDHLPEQVWHQLQPQENVPDGYFAQLPDKVLQRIRTEENEDPVLDLPVRKQPYRVPDNYFDQLPEQVIPRARQNKTRVVHVQRRWQTIAVAAAVLGAIIIGYFTLQPQENNTQLSFEKLSTEELTDYLASNLDEWHTEQVVELSEQEMTLLIDSTQTEEIEDWILEDMDIEDLEDLL